jgi:hypothetical protein
VDVPNIDHLNGSVYHMVHFENLHNIFQRRAFLAQEKVFQEDIRYRSIAFEEVQGLRDRIYVWDNVKQRYRKLHSYFPLYFAKRTPMLFVQYRQGIQEKIVIFEVSRSILKEPGVVFTDGNASNQQLARYGREKVGVIPAATLGTYCQRIYRPDGPHGTNPNRSNFYADIAFLDPLDWDVINDRWFNDDEKRRIKHAEVLVPELLPLGSVTGIFVGTWDMVDAVNVVIEECGLTGRIPSAVRRPDLYF